MDCPAVCVGKLFMGKLVVLYATREGQTRKVAEYLAAQLENRQCNC